MPSQPRSSPISARPCWPLLLALVACAPLSAGCGWSSEMPKVLDSAAVKAACGGTELNPPVGGKSDGLWVLCEGAKTLQIYDGKAFKKVDVPGAVPAVQPQVGADGSLYVLTRDPQEPTTTNPRLLQHVFPDGRIEDRTADVNPTRAEELKLVGVGGTIVIERGTAVYLVNGETIAALPLPMDGNFRILGVLPVLSEAGHHDHFFLHVAVGAGSPGTPDDVLLFYWTGSQWQSVILDDPTEKLRFTGFPRLFVPVAGTGEFFGIANQQGAQDRIVPIVVARWNGTTLRATEIKLSVESGYFGPQQLFTKLDGKVVVLGTESEGNDNVVNRLAYYEFTGEDFRKRFVFKTIQDCSKQECDRSASDPVFLVDGAVQYVIADGDGSFEVLVDKL